MDFQWISGDSGDFWVPEGPWAPFRTLSGIQVRKSAKKLQKGVPNGHLFGRLLGTLGTQIEKVALVRHLLVTSFAGLEKGAEMDRPKGAR